MGGVVVNLVERVMHAGHPLNADQLRVLLAGCNMMVTHAEAQWLFTRYRHQIVPDHHTERAVSRR